MGSIPTSGTISVRKQGRLRAERRLAGASRNADDFLDLCAIPSNARGLSTEVRLGAEAGLAHESVASSDDSLLLDRSRLVRRLGRASTETMQAA